MKKNKVKLMEDKSKLNIDNVQLEEVGYDKIEQPNKRAFLVALSETGNITSASKISGIARNTHYNWMESDPAYAAAYKVALEQAAENLETEARRRAVQGTLRPVFYQGNECGVVREYSDTLLIFLLKGAMPGKYKDNVSVDANVSITFEQLLKKALESGE
jgi:hypothetical protein